MAESTASWRPRSAKDGTAGTVASSVLAVFALFALFDAAAFFFVVILLQQGRSVRAERAPLVVPRSPHGHRPRLRERAGREVSRAMPPRRAGHRARVGRVCQE